MEKTGKLLDSPLVRRLLILLSIALILFLLRGLFNIIVLTFIFTFLIYNIQNFLVQNLQRIVKVQRKIVIIILYAGLAFGIGFILYKYTPILIKQTVSLADQAYALYKNPGENQIAQMIVRVSEKVRINEYISQGVDLLFSSAKKIGFLGLDLFLSFLLSLFFALEKKRVIRFTEGIRTSKLSRFYDEIEYFGHKFTQSFGKVMQTQIIIAFTNCILSIIGLWLLGFPNIVGLAVMIFLLGLIPVAGVLISLIPLTMIGFNIGGLNHVLYVLGMIAVLHAIEAYVLNPRIMSAKTDLPVFFVFAVLIVSEFIIGPWGLIIGIPLFVFILDILEINYKKAHHLPEKTEHASGKKAP